MEVILIDDVFELGRRGDVVKVASGYGRNFLIPKKLAVPATPGNLKMVEQQRVALAKREAKDRGEAEILAAELGQIHIVVSRKAGDTGVLFGSVTSKDLTDVLAANGITLDRRKILLHQPIKSIGNYTVEVRPHSDVDASLLLSVFPEAGEQISKTLPRGEESDKVVEELKAKVEEIERLAGTASAESEEPAE
ncbi:MAG: 50S ribosomal protein L9 [Acidobacteriota bacterium]